MNKILHQSVRFCSGRPPSLGQLLNVAPVGKRCEVFGWVKAARKQKQNTFLDLTDGTSGKVLQVVAETANLPKDSVFHSCVKIQGEMIKSGHPNQEVELRADMVEVLASPDPSIYPFQPRRTVGKEFIRKHPTCKAKLNGVSSLLRIRNNLSQNIHKFFQSRDYLEIHTPILTTNDCEGGGDVFTVVPPTVEDNGTSYWDKPVHLTVSGQLHLEAICNGIARVYTFNPAFRAERGRTRRHLSEFWMVEAEIAFVDKIDDIVDVMDDLVKDSARSLFENNSMRQDFEVYSKSAKLSSSPLDSLESIMKKELVRMTYKEVVDLVARKGPVDLAPLTFGDDLAREHELWLCEMTGSTVAIVDWPSQIKPFYMREVKEGGSLVSCVDLLVPGVGELCGGSLREYCPNTLAKRLGSAEGLEWYVDLRKQGAAPTGGFGLGFERLVQFLVGVEHIKDTVPFHRTPHSCVL